ncbi:MAG: bifunctional folylpolyglutamate synthase/dihydrofolate synthase [Spirochaetales bacterium]|nr:bifunctional folylpolyglutamate synthase/dihydrofolate synthase [Spirochaetales bacterium]
MDKIPYSVDDGFAWMESFTNLEKTPAGATREYRLDRMEYLATLFGKPQNSFKIIHTAGSKGKGSTSAFMAAGLAARGYKTGIYTSPHVTTYRERISLSGGMVPEEVYLENICLIRETVELIPKANFPGSGEPTTFELLTLLAFLVFRQLRCQWVVLETGLGGRLDATNIVMPEASVITPIELEHTEYLGSTIEEIAAEKGGIIKTGRPVFCGILSEKAEGVIKKRAAEKGAPFHALLENADISTSLKEQTTRIQWIDGSRCHLHLAMAGVHQGENAALAALVLRELFSSGRESPAECFEKAFNTTSLPGRMERFEHGESVWILDGAHTPASLRLTVATFRGIYGDNGILIFGSAMGKSPEGLAGETAGKFRDIIITRAGSFKPEDPGKVFEAFGDARTEADEAIRSGTLNLIPDPVKAFKKAEDYAAAGRPVLVTGSFYMAGEIRPLLMKD